MDVVSMDHIELDSNKEAYKELIENYWQKKHLTKAVQTQV